MPSKAWEMAEQGACGPTKALMKVGGIGERDDVVLIIWRLSMRHSAVAERYTSLGTARPPSHLSTTSSSFHHHLWPRCCEFH